jgi:hypothetical protein
LRALSLPQLPQLVELALRPEEPDATEICRVLSSASWLARLSRLGLHDLGGLDLVALANGLGGRRLAQLDLTNTNVRPECQDALAALADDVVPRLAARAPDGDIATSRVLRRFEGKLEIDFPLAGAKIFKADERGLARLRLC